MNASFRIVLLALLAGWFSTTQIEAQGKTCHMKEIDMCLTNYYYDLKGIPTNERQMKKACTSTKTLHKCVHTYLRRCMSRPLEETMGLLFNGAVEPFLADCAKPANDAAKLEIYKYGKCINDKQKEVSNVCGDLTKEAIFYLLDQNFDRRVGASCCNLKRAFDCSYNKTSEVCSRAHADFGRKFIASFQIIESLCENYNPNDASCDGLLAPAGYVSKEDPKSPLNRMINAFF